MSFIVAGTVGCGKGHVGLGGRVTYSDTGEPLERGTVSFATSTFLARGEVTQNGHYRVGTFTDKDGLPKGTYRVFITGAVRVEGSTESPIVHALIDKKYSSPETSGLTLEIDRTNKQFDIQVDRAVESKGKKSGSKK